MISPASTNALTTFDIRSRRRSSTNPTIEQMMTMIVTDTTVTITLFFVAVWNMLLRAVNTSTRFSLMCHDVGHDRSRRADWARSLTAVRKMKPNGTTNTTIATASATASSQYLRTKLTTPARFGAAAS